MTERYLLTQNNNDSLTTYLIFCAEALLSRLEIYLWTKKNINTPIYDVEIALSNPV